MLNVYLFGAPRIVENGQPVVIQRRQARTLFFYLAAQEKPQSRLALITLLWPDEPERKARAKLNDLFGKIRSDTQPDILQASGEIVTLNWQKVSVDYLEYRRLLEGISGRILPDAAAMTISKYNTMKELARRWGGDEFFAGYNLSNFENLEYWQTEINAQIFRELPPVLARLSDYERQHRHFEQAIDWLLLATRLDSFNEEWRLRILEIYLKTGKHSLAQKYFESTREFWEAEMGTDLPDGLLTLEDEIYHPRPATSTATKPTWPTKTSIEIPFIGYQQALQSLFEQWNSGEAAIILGESGAGKTRLVQEFFQRIDPPPRLMLGVCQQLEANQPFAPWASMLRNFVPPETWQKLDGIWVQALTLLLPELAALRKDVSPIYSQTQEFSRSVLVEAIHQTLKVLAGRQPLLIFLDDTQWADEASLAVVSRLLGHHFFRESEQIIVFAARVEERNPLLDILLATHSSKSLRKITLSGLYLDEIGEIASYLLGQTVSPAFVERLDRDTGGTPLFVLEILQSLIEDGLPEHLEDIDALPLPQSVHHILQRRLDTLPEDAREIIDTAAFFGNQFSLDLIERATHFKPEIILSAMELLEKARLLQAVPVDVPTYGFLHDKIRESILIEISPARKRFFHHNIARALDEEFGEQKNSPQAATLAYHYQEAGNLPRAFDFWVRAGKYAHRLASLHESMSAFEQAERLIPRMPGVSEFAIYELYTAWNDALFQNDNPDSIKRISKTLLLMGEERHSPLLIGTALSGMSDAYMAENNFQAAIDIAQESLNYVRECGNTYEIVRTLDRIGVYTYMLNQLPHSQQFFEQSLALSRDSIDAMMVLQRCSTYYQLAITSTLNGKLLDGLNYAKKTLRDAVRAYHPYGQVLAYSVQGLAYYLLGDFENGLIACQQGMALEHFQAWRMLGYISSYYAMNAAELGRLDEAWEYGQKAITIGHQHGHGEVAGLGYKAIGDMYFRLNAHDKAIKSYQQGMLAAGEHFVALENMHRYGYLLYRQGQIVLGKELLQNALTASAQGGFWSIHFLASIYDLEILARERQYEQLEERAAWFREQSLGYLGFDITGPTLARLRIARALEEKDFATTLALTEQVLPWYQKKNMFWRELECLRAMQAAKQALKQTDQAESGQIARLLQHVEMHIGKAPVAETWQKFKAQILQSS